jgi:hypothetical protein
MERKITVFTSTRHRFLSRAKDSSFHCPNPASKIHFNTTLHTRRDLTSGPRAEILYAFISVMHLRKDHLVRYDQ